jgi:hypothetical protein
VNAARPIHSGVGRPNGTSARPQPRTMAVITGHTGQRRRNGALSSPITALIPSPSAEAAVPGSTLRNTGWLRAG